MYVGCECERERERVCVCQFVSAAIGSLPVVYGCVSNRSTSPVLHSSFTSFCFQSLTTYCNPACLFLFLFLFSVLPPYIHTDIHTCQTHRYRSDIGTDRRTDGQTDGQTYTHSRLWDTHRCCYRSTVPTITTTTTTTLLPTTHVHSLIDCLG